MVTYRLIEPGYFVAPFAVGEHVRVAFSDLPRDLYSKNAGRFRRFSQFKIGADGTVSQLPPRPFLQRRGYNETFDRVERVFEPLAVDCKAEILQAARAFRLESDVEWQCNAQMIRVMAEDGNSGVPVPEGPHQDGHQLVAIVCVSRHDVIGAETIVRNAVTKTQLLSTILQAGTALFLNDQVLTHFTSDIHEGCRDIMIITFNDWAHRRYGETHEQEATVVTIPSNTIIR